MDERITKILLDKIDQLERELYIEKFLKENPIPDDYKNKYCQLLSKLCNAHRGDNSTSENCTAFLLGDKICPVENKYCSDVIADDWQKVLEKLNESKTTD